jgi:hypothetical protein
VFGWWAATPWRSLTLHSIFYSIPSFLSWLPWQLRCMAIRGFMVTMTSPMHGNWRLPFSPSSFFFPSNYHGNLHWREMGPDLSYRSILP